MHKVFVYGTLMAEEVVKALLQRPHVRYAAKVAGFKRHRVQEEVFPAIIPSLSADQISGWVIAELTDEELSVFDEFEDVEYYRDEVPVTKDDGNTETVYIYVWKDAGRCAWLFRAAAD